MTAASRLLCLAAWLWLTLGLSATVDAATYTVSADRDSELVENSANQNNGGATQLEVRTNGGGTNRRRAIYGFTLPAIPANEMIVSATIRSWVRRSDNRVVSIHRVTDTWTENGVTWSNSAADFNPAAESSFTPSTNNAYATASLLALVRGWRNGSIANHGVVLHGATSADSAFTAREWGTASQRPELVIVTAVVPPLTVVKSSQPYFDPLNGLTNPKAIPGGFVAYTVSVSNPGSFVIDGDSVVIVDATPGNLRLYVSDVPGGSGPVLFQDGTPASGLSYAYSGLASLTDDVDFSDNGGATWTYVPTANADLVDPNVTHIRIRPKGTMAAGSGFLLQLGYLVQ